MINYMSQIIFDIYINNGTTHVEVSHVIYTGTMCYISIIFYLILYLIIIL